MSGETGGLTTELRQAVATRLDDLNACGYLVYPHPNTGEPMQEQVSVDYLAEAVMDVLAARVGDQAAALARVEAECAWAEEHGDRDQDGEVWVEVRVIRAALRGGDDDTNNAAE